MKQTSDIAFAPDWLALREPADHTARHAGLLERAAATVGPGALVLDLGSGAGSTVRAFANAGHNDLNWRLFDNDPKLLALATKQNATAKAVIGDLGDVHSIPFEGAGLVTASALLDLMSVEWITSLAKRLRAANLPFYAALNYDGVMHWMPTDADDAQVTAHFNAHQQRDKGTGPALGPRSVPEAARVFTEFGFDVHLGASPWRIGADQAALQLQLLDGIADAVAEIEPAIAPTWHRARKAFIKQGRAYVGHLDLLALPAQPNV